MELRSMFKEYQETERCSHPLSEVFQLIGLFTLHKDHTKFAKGYSWFLHVGLLKGTPLVDLYLVLFDNDKMIGVQNSLYHTDSKTLEIAATTTKDEYKRRGLENWI